MVLARSISAATARFRLKRRAWWGLFYLILVALAVAIVVPFLFMLSTSFTASFTMMNYPPTLIPENPNLENYVNIVLRFQGGLFPRWFLNSLVVTVAITGGSLLINTLAGYLFAKRVFYGRDVLFVLILSTLMIPTSVTLIPAFLVIRKFNFYDTYWAVIIPGLASPFGIFLMRQFITTLPTELIEAAKIDGAGELEIFWRIVLPLSKPALAALGIFTCLGAWNSFLWPLIVLPSQDMYTLVVGLATIATEFTVDYGMVMAGSVLTLIPLLILFALFQPYFVEGLRLGYGK